MVLPAKPEEKVELYQHVPRTTGLSNYSLRVFLIVIKVMYNTLIIQISVLLAILILPMRTNRRALLVIALFWYSYKSWLIVGKLLELIGKILMRSNYSSYRDVANSIFRDNFRVRSNFGALPSKPTILVTNYPMSLLEYLAPALVPGSTCLLASKVAKRWMSLVYTSSECCYIPTEKGGRYDIVKELIRERLKSSHVIVYVEDYKRRYGRSVGSLWKGTFWMAKELNATVTPLVIDKVYENKCCIPEQNFGIHVGPTMNVLDPVATLIRVRTLMREIKTLFTLNKFKTNNLSQYNPSLVLA